MTKKEFEKRVAARKALILDRLNSPFRLTEADAVKEDRRRELSRKPLKRIK